MIIGNLLGNISAGGGDTGIRENNSDLVIATTEITGVENTASTTTVLGTQRTLVATAITAGAITWSITKDGVAVTGVTVNATGQIVIANTVEHTDSGDYKLTAEATGQYTGKATGIVKITLSKRPIVGFTVSKTIVNDLHSNIVSTPLIGGEAVTASVIGTSAYSTTYKIDNAISIGQNVSGDHSTRTAGNETIIINFNIPIKLTNLSVRTGRNNNTTTEFWRNFSFEYFDESNILIGAIQNGASATLVPKFEATVPSNDLVKVIRIKGWNRAGNNVGFNNIMIGHDTNFFT